jgi:hypothetical protein
MALKPVIAVETQLETINLKHALVSEIELKNGKKTKVVTIFNSSDLNFEEMNFGVNTALKRINSYKNTMKDIKTSFGSLENGTFEKVTTFENVNPY